VLDAGFNPKYEQIERVCPIDFDSDEGVVMRAIRTPSKSRLAMSCLRYKEALEFCRSRGGRLPTSPEWALAARGTTEDLHHAVPWGPTGSGVVARMEAGSADLPVGSHPQDTNPQGVQDLYGNMVEWTDSTPVRALVDAMRRPYHLVPYDPGAPPFTKRVYWTLAEERDGKPPVLGGSWLQCIDCTSAAPITFGMGLTGLGQDLYCSLPRTAPAGSYTGCPTGKDLISYQRTQGCDLCHPELSALDYRSPLMGFRCAYDIAESQAR
jgi:hypothetical protein